VRFWKPLLIILPAGLLLGMAMGQSARPVMTQRVSDEPWQAMFHSRADRDGSTNAYPSQVAGPAYDGGYSYAPAWVTDASWTPPDYTRYADVPLPTVAQLDARQARLLADPDKEFAVAPTADAVAGAAQDTQVAADQARQGAGEPAADLASADPADVAPEPRTADGQPAIW
jgi:hypothetical protein